MPGDLHNHSTCSDGSVPIHRLPLMAARAGLDTMAISDHDTLLSVNYCYEHPVQDGVRLLPATELTGYNKMISESYLGRATIDTNTYGKSTGRSGSYSTNYQLSGRELYTADEIRMLDNRYALLFIRGEHPIQDEKYDILRHPNIKLTTDGGMRPYLHGQAPRGFDPDDILLSGDYADYEVLSEDEIYQLYQKESEE